MHLHSVGWSALMLSIACLQVNATFGAEVSDRELVQRALSLADGDEDYYWDREVIEAETPAGKRRIVILSPGGKLRDGFLAVFTANGRLTSSGRTEAIKDVRVVRPDRKRSFLATVEVTGSGIGFHRETFYLRRVDDMGEKVFQQVVRKHLAGPYPHVERMFARVETAAEGGLAVLSVKTEGEKRMDGGVKWDSPELELALYRWNKQEERFLRNKDHTRRTLYSPSESGSER